MLNPVALLGDREKDKKHNLFVIHPHHDTPQQQPSEKEKEKEKEKDKKKEKEPQYYEVDSLVDGAPR